MRSVKLREGEVETTKLNIYREPSREQNYRRKHRRTKTPKSILDTTNSKPAMISVARRPNNLKGNETRVEPMIAPMGGPDTKIKGSIQDIL